MSEDYAAKSVRLVQPTGTHGGGRPMVAPPPPRAPVRTVAAVPNHTPAELQQFVESERTRDRLKATAERAALAVQEAGGPRSEHTGTPESFQEAMGKLQTFVGTQENGGTGGVGSNPSASQHPQAFVTGPGGTGSGASPVQAPPPEKEEPPPEVPLSSFDIEVMEMADQLDVGALVLDGYLAMELPILEGVYSVSVRSLRKTDILEINKDVDNFRRGVPVDPDKPDGQRLLPFPHAVEEFAESRRIAQGLLGLNGIQMTNRWEQRMAELEDLDAALFSAISREYRKFLMAVSLLFPDKMTKEAMMKLRDRLGKAQSRT